jgi:hypothetical protein
MTSACFWPMTIPLLIFWLKPETSGTSAELEIVRDAAIEANGLPLTLLPKFAKYLPNPILHRRIFAGG